MKKIDLRGVIKVLLFLAAVCTTSYLLMLGYYNSLSLDDYGFAVKLSHMTPWEWTKNMYMTWQGRFTGFFVSGYIFKIFGRPESLFLWTIIHLFLGYLIIYLYVRDVFGTKDRLTGWSIAVLVENVTIMSVFEISTFYWLCCAGYFLTIYASLLLFYSLFYATWRILPKSLISVVCAMYISGSAENFTPLILLILGIIWIFVIVHDTKSYSFKIAFINNWLLFVVCVILFIGFLIMVSAPGNMNRLIEDDGIVGFMYDFRLSLFIKKTIIANTIFSLRLISRSLYFLCMFPIFSYIGKELGDEHSISKKYFVRKVGLATILLFSFIFISVTVCVYGTGYYPPLRAMSFVPYFVMVYTAYVGYLSGMMMAHNHFSIMVNRMMIVSCFGWMLFSCYEFAREYPIVKEYHSYIVQRDNKISDLAKERYEGLYYIEAYNPPLWMNTYSYIRAALKICIGSSNVVREPYFPYVISELSKDDPQDLRNKGLGDYYNANFNILTK